MNCYPMRTHGNSDRLCQAHCRVGIASENIETFFSVKGNAHQTNYHWEDLVGIVSLLELDATNIWTDNAHPTISYNLKNYQR